MDERIPTKKRALRIWARAWQLTGGEWPPPSRGIAHQIVMMLTHNLQAVSDGRLDREEAFLLARETMAPLTAQKFYPGGEQDVAVERLRKALLEAEVGDL